MSNELIYIFLLIIIVLLCLIIFIIIYEANRIVKNQNKTIQKNGKNNKNESNFKYVRVRSMDDMKNFTEKNQK